MKISEIAAVAGVTASRIRYYERHGLLPQATRRANGYRDYDPSVAKHLKTIILSQELGFSLAEIRRVLPEDPDQSMPCEHIVENLEQKLTEVDKHMSDLVALKGRLTAMLQHFEDQKSADGQTDLAAMHARKIC